MRAKFTFKIRKAINLRDRLYELINQKDFLDYLEEMGDQEVVMDLKPSVRSSDKLRMYDYYHKVVLGSAMRAYEDEGWESMDKVKADYMLKAECAKDVMYNPKSDTESIYLIDKAAMNKERLRKYITDCIYYLEIEKGVRVPDSAEYKAFQQTGIKGFKSIK